MSYCGKCGKELLENVVCECQKNNQTNNIKKYQPKVSKGSKVGSVLTGIIYPSLFIILAVFLYNIEETSLLGMIVAIGIDIAAAVIIIMGGFYLLIIPLPFVYFYKVGCTKPNIPKWRKIIFAILSFVLLFGSIGILFLFSKI